MTGRTGAAPPDTLDAAGIAARVPHAGAMVLLARLARWDDTVIECTAADHAVAAHPLRGARGLHAVHAAEYASQAMALHGALCAERDAPGTPPAPGFLAALRALRLSVAYLDDAPGPLRVRAERQAGDARQALYAFALRDAGGRLLAEGRATVVLQGRPGRGAPIPTTEGPASAPANPR